MREYLSVLRPLVNEGSVGFNGQMFQVNGALQAPEATPFPILVAAGAPMLLRIAGELAEGAITWVAGRKTIETFIVPRINAAAAAVGPQEPRVCAALVISVTDNIKAAHKQAAKFLGAGSFYPPYYRHLLDIEGVEEMADVAIIGKEAEVERQLRALADAGTTELIALILPVDGDTKASYSRTRTLLKGLVGKI